MLCLDPVYPGLRESQVSSSLIKRISWLSHGHELVVGGGSNYDQWVPGTFTFQILSENGTRGTGTGTKYRYRTATLIIVGCWSTLDQVRFQSDDQPGSG